VLLPNTLANKRILITGGGTGLGKSMGRRFLDLGAELVICGRREAVLKDTAGEFADAFGRPITWYVCDVRQPEAIAEMLDAIWRERPLEGLVNNAAGNFIARSETLSHRAVDAVLNIVLHGSANVTLDCGRRWLAEDHSAVVLSILATYAWTGSPYVVPSAMAKAGVLAMTRSLAVEWGGRGIRFNAIAPGAFPTDGAWSRLLPRPEMANRFETSGPLGRPGEHLELANLASYLMSDYAAYLNGEVVTIDGGRWLKGASQFSDIGDELSAEDWSNIHPSSRR
jgi:NAD(P)-dependent dehydrogenase (short-subunit alcohol dehydrogenase family)